MAAGIKSRVGQGDRCIAVWLFGLALMVFVMIVIGGLTRLTESGLSMVHWRPVTGWLPPLSDAEWQRVFAAYRSFPEYQLVNAGMSLADFKEIFWLEYIHRLWGRLLGIAFLIPFVIFVVKKWLDKRRFFWLLSLFVLGGLQGVLGWYMVKSGLVDRPDVSQYRLVAHLVFALVIYSALIWLGLRFYVDGLAKRPARYRPPLVMALLMIFITIVFGGFMAGLNAGYASQTFPLMDERLIPEGLFDDLTLYMSLFEDVWTVHFVHRWLGMLTLIAVVTCWVLERWRRPERMVRLALDAWLSLAFVQVALGIATVMTTVWLPMAAAHQAVAVLLWTATLVTLFMSRSIYPAATATEFASKASHPLKMTQA